MMYCELCDKKINPLKDAHHTIPLGSEVMIIMCDDCYKGFKEYITLDDIMEGLQGDNSEKG